MFFLKGLAYSKLAVVNSFGLRVLSLPASICPYVRLLICASTPSMSAQ